MNDGTLVRKSLFRKKTRAILLVLSIMTAFLIFGLLGSFSRVFTGGADSAVADRLVTVNSINFTLSMPYAYYERISAMEGVESVVHNVWFGGYYQDPTRFVQAFASNIDQYFVVYDELEIVEGSLDDTVARRDCVAVGRALADQYGFTLGQRFPEWLDRRVEQALCCAVQPVDSGQEALPCGAEFQMSGGIQASDLTVRIVERKGGFDARQFAADGRDQRCRVVGRAERD